jgi:hypothetical protein
MIDGHASALVSVMPGGSEVYHVEADGGEDNSAVATSRTASVNHGSK